MVILNVLGSFFKFALIFGSPIIGIYIVYLCHCFYLFLHGSRLKKSSSEWHDRPVIFKLLWDFPKQWAVDTFNRDPDHFTEKGVHLVCGEQGSGKTIFITWYLDMMRKRYPKMRFRTNYFHADQHAEINHWQDIIFTNNGQYGMIDVIDEISSWFSSLQSKDFPPEMLTEITQQRKQRKMILGTGQVFNRVAKPIREQSFYVYQPYTFFGCLTLVFKYKASLTEDATLKKSLFRKLFVIVQTPELRDKFDTYKRITNLADSGFQERTWQQERPIYFGGEEKKGLFKKK